MEVRNETNMDRVSRSMIKADDVQQTELVPRNDAEWNHNFFYNTGEMVDDNITFILREDNKEEVGRETIRNLALDAIKQEGDVVGMTVARQTGRCS